MPGSLKSIAIAMTAFAALAAGAAAHAQPSNMPGARPGADGQAAPEQGMVPQSGQHMQRGMSGPMMQSRPGSMMGMMGPGMMHHMMGGTSGGMMGEQMTMMTQMNEMMAQMNRMMAQMNQTMAQMNQMRQAQPSGQGSTTPPQSPSRGNETEQGSPDAAMPPSK